MKVLGGESVTWWLDKLQFFFHAHLLHPAGTSVISVQILVWMSMRPFLYGKIYLYMPKDGSDIHRFSSRK